MYPEGTLLIIEGTEYKNLTMKAGEIMTGKESKPGLTSCPRQLHHLPLLEE